MLFDLNLFIGLSITLTWQDLLNIAMAGLTIWQFLRAQRISEARDDVLRRQAAQTAAHGFAQMATEAYNLETWVGKDDWERSLDVAKRLVVSLAEGLGSWSLILEPSDRDKADASRNEIMSVELSIPVQGPIAADVKERMRNSCITSAMLLAEIAGRLKIPAELRTLPEGARTK